MNSSSGDILKPSSANPLRWADQLLLALFCAALFGYVAISGRPLTLHEARLPQSSREMMAAHNWLIPMNGDRPWLERPPFPHWVMISVAKAIGRHCDTQWSVRIPPALMGLLIVLMIARIAGGWFGRGTGILAGLVLATMYEFYAYSTLAEDDIFLAFLVVAAMACFIRLEFFSDPQVQDSRLKVLGWRPWPVVAFFLLLGLTNLAKGPLVGAALVIGPIAAYFLMPSMQWRTGSLGFFFRFPAENRRRLRRYFWLWGILAAALVGISWHLYAHLRYPGVGGYLANLRYDFSQTHEYDEPWWYYPPQLLARTLPWSPAAVLALFITARQAWRKRDPILRFLWCWAIVPIIVLSIPHRKHHHYLVPVLAPWAILAALGLRTIALHLFDTPAWSRRPRFGLLVIGLPVAIVLAALLIKGWLGPWDVGVFLIAVWVACVWAYYHGLWIKNPRWNLAAILLGVAVIYSWQQSYLPDDTRADTQFLRQDVQARVPANELLAIDGALGPLDFFRVQFYLRGNALLLHNLSYLRSDQIHAADVYVVARIQDLQPLQTLGKVREVARSWRPIKPNTPQLALFHLIFNRDLKRYPPPPVSPMQAMVRRPGPFCGPPLPESP